MKQNLLKSVILSVILLMGVCKVWALDIYLDFSSIDWPKDGAVIKLYPGAGSDVVGTNLSTVKVYKFTVPSASGEMWFKRINPNDQNETWDQASITYDPNHNNVYKLTGWKKVECADYNINIVNPVNYIYFDNSITNTTWTYTKKYFVIGHDKPSTYSIAYDMYEIENTQLFYTHNIGNTWTDATYYSFFANDNALSGNVWGITKISTSAKAYTAPFTSHQPLNSGKYYLCTPTSKENNQPFNISEYSSYTDLNHTQTIKAQVKYGETNPAYKQVISPATITATTHYFGSDYTKVDQTGSLTISRGETNPANLTQTVTAAYTSTVTLSYTNLHDAYEFIDWWDDTNKKTISTSSSCTYVATKATTIYARFKAKEDYTRTVYLDARNWNNDQPRYAVYAYYGAESGQFEWIDMTAACGTNWYYTCEIPAKYSHVIFCRMNPANNNNTFNDDSRWGQTNDLLLLLDLDKNNCFTPSGDPTEQGGKTYNGNWSTPPTFTVTLEGSSNGTFVVKYNNQEQSSSSNNITINIPICTQLTITYIQPNDGYDQTMVYNTGVYTEFDTYEVDNQGNRTYTYTVTSDVIIAEDFRTKESHTIFVKVPKGNASAYWEGLRIIPMNGITQSKAETAESVNEFAEQMEVWQNIDEYILYYFTIPAGNHSFKLYPANNTEASNSFWYEILPKDGTKDINQNCWVIDNKESNTNADGTWVASKVYLDPCKYGTYGIRCNGQEYYNYADNQRIVELPFGAVLEPIDAVSTSPYYGPNPRYASSIVINEYFEVNLNTPLTLIDQIRYSANLVTTQPHRVILHIPNNILSDWNADVPYNCVYAKDYRSYGSCKFDEASQTYIGKLIEGTKLGSEEYYYFDIPAGFNNFVFERKTSLGEGVGPHRATNDFLYQIPLDENLVYTLTGKDSNGKFIGTWGPLPKCTVELGYCEFGTHGIKYKGQEYFANHNETTNTKVIVSYGDEVEVLPGQPMRSDAYTNHAEQWIDKNPNDNKSYDTKIKTFDKFDGVENKVTITEKTLFDDCFLTKEPHDVYIGIPNTGMDNIWYQKIANENGVDGDGDIYVWPITNNAGKDLAVKTEEFENEGVTYYKFTLPEGINAFYFQRKGYWGNGTTYCQSVKLLYEIPLNEENCYMLDKGKTPGGSYTGYWTSMPANEDFRLLYVEQEVIKAEDTDGDKWLTKVNRTYEHQSDIIKKRNSAGSDVVSLHIYTRGNNPEIILQQYDGKERKWVDIEAHMVNGPLEATPGMGMLPGRKNASPGSDIDDFVYDDGIEKIKNDPTDDGCGVWNFTVIQDGKSAKLDLRNGLERYTGKYYIRTANAEGKWIDYTIPANHITFSPYAKQHHGEYFSHYFCKWVDLDKHYNDVSFIIANDHAKSLTDPSYLFDDKYVNNQWLPENANIRWGWSIINNKVSRAYIAGSYEGANDFLVVTGSDSKVKLQENINKQIGYFNDNTNWLYYADLLAQPEAQVKVRARYNKKDQYFMGTDDQFQKLIGGNFAQDQRYHPIRILYDFKEHRFVVGYHPENKIEDKDVTIETPVMLIRRHHDAPNQISFDNTALDPLKIEAPMPAYGVITFLEEKLTSETISKNEKMFYWVSFPFNVKISHVFGLGEYGSHWVMEEYDGKTRADEGWNIYNTFWRYITDTTRTLEAGKGYVLCLNYNRIINEAFLSGENEEVSLYFPSVVAVDQSTIQSQGAQNVNIPTWIGAAPQKDHNWNLIGAISYANTGETTQQSNSKFLYEYQPADDTYSPRASNGYTFNALHAYMVQYAGTITWTSHIAPLSIAAKRDAENDDNMHELSLDLILNGTTQDQTFIQLEDGEATQMFDLNIDMTKIINSGANIYSISSDNNQLAGNVLPIEETIIPLGVVTAAAGEYTFAMPNGTDGIVVELIDYETNTRTNMLLDEYTINLAKGTFENRFALHVKPNKTTTSIVDVNTNSNGVRKFIIDGTLYMQKDGVLYDAQGRCVQ